MVVVMGRQKKATRGLEMRDSSGPPIKNPASVKGEKEIKYPSQLHEQATGNISHTSTENKGIPPGRFVPQHLPVPFL